MLTEMMRQRLENVKKVSIVDYLSSEEIHPVRKAGGRWLYHAPYRTDKHPSFIVTLAKNLWFDLSYKTGGSIIDLVMRYKNIAHVGEAMTYIEKLDLGAFPPCAASSEANNAKQQKEDNAHASIGKVKVIELKNWALVSYLQSRKIDLYCARRYMREIHYSIGQKHYYGLGFVNNSAGYAIRNKYFKGCIGHQDITLIFKEEGNKQKHCAVFEGFMDFLSFITLIKKRHRLFLMEFPCDIIVMNSVTNMEKCMKALEEYPYIHCFLDNDAAGQCATTDFKALYGYRITDESFRYGEYKDLNDFLVGIKM